MASPQKENGYTAIAHEIMEALAMHKFTEYQRAIIMCILRKTYGFNKTHDWIANSQFVEATGIRKGHVSRTIKELKELKVVTYRGNKIGLNKNWERWKVTCRGNRSYLRRSQKLPPQEPQKIKDTIQKKVSVNASAISKLKANKMRDYEEPIVDMDGDGEAHIPEKPGAKHEKLFKELLVGFKPVNRQYAAMTAWKGQREAMRRMLELHGEEKIRKAIIAVGKTCGKPYFPLITDFVTLEKKYEALVEAIKRSNEDKADSHWN